MALGLHHAQLMLHAQKRSQHIGVEGRRVAFRGLLRHRAGLAFGAGIVDGHVEPTKARDRSIDQVGDLIVVAHIGTYEFRLPPLPQFGGQRLAGFITAAGDDDAGAFASEGKGSGASYAGEGARDQDDWGCSYRYFLIRS